MKEKILKKGTSEVIIEGKTNARRSNFWSETDLDY